MTISQLQLIPNLELVHEHTVYKFVDGMLSNKIEFPSIEIVVKKDIRLRIPLQSHIVQIIEMFEKVKIKSQKS
jgi:hypothetical protein